MDDFSCHSTGGTMHSLSWLDSRYNARILLKKPGFKFIAVLALALEIGTNSAIFSIAQKPLSKSATTPRLENKILGEGAPTVVFSPGFSGQMKTWFGIQPVVAKYTRTFVYHRAGFGRSEMGPEPRTADRLATELRESLKEAKADPPFLLVGLSVGGLYDRVFAHKYPDDIAGIILVDPATEDIYDFMRTSDPDRWNQNESKTLQENPGIAPGWAGQWRALPESIKQARSSWPLPKVPALVLTGMSPIPNEWAFENSEDMERWLLAHKNIVNRIPGCEHIVIREASHGLLDEKLLTEKIVAMVKQIQIAKRNQQ
jgi:pimeloyl-ACP methyl ester carboxylesterase